MCIRDRGARREPPAIKQGGKPISENPELDKEEGISRIKKEADSI